MKVRVVWWSTGVGRLDRYNTTCFPNSEFVPSDKITEKTFTEGADLIVTSLQILDRSGFKPTIPTIAQLGGLTDTKFFKKNGTVKVSFSKSLEYDNIIINLLDPQLYRILLKSNVADKIKNNPKVVCVPTGIPADFKQWESSIKYSEKRAKETFIVPRSRVAGKLLSSRKADKFVKKLIPDSSKEFLREKILMGKQTLQKKFSKFTVLNPSGNTPIKNPENFYDGVRLVNEHRYKDKIDFIMTTRKHDDLPKPSNVSSYNQVPWEKMAFLYNACNVIAPYSSLEIFPNTVLESLYFGKPTIVNSCGLFLTIGKQHLPIVKESLGKSATQVDEELEPFYFSGDHILIAPTPEKFAEGIENLYRDEAMRNELGNKAKEWTNNWITQEEKYKILIEKLKSDKSLRN